MLTPEVLNFIGGTVISSLFKLLAQHQANTRDLIELGMKSRDRADASADAASKRDAGQGGPMTRRMIALLVMVSVFVVPPLLAALFPEVPIFYAYNEASGGLWFLSSGLEKLHFVRCDGFTLLPIHTQLASLIAGYYFGSGIVKTR